MIIKRTNDFILSVAMIALSLFLVFSDKVVSGPSNSGLGGYFARADVYLKMLGMMMLITSVLLLIKSIGFNKNTPKIRFSFYLSSTIVCILAAIAVYAVALPSIGFAVSTTVILLFLSGLFYVKERNKKMKEYTKKEIIKLSIFLVSFSLISVVLLYFIFTNGLNVQLP